MLSSRHSNSEFHLSFFLLASCHFDNPSSGSSPGGFLKQMETLQPDRRSLIGWLQTQVAPARLASSYEGSLFPTSVTVQAGERFSHGGVLHL